MIGRYNGKWWPVLAFPTPSIASLLLPFIAFILCSFLLPLLEQTQKHCTVRGSCTAYKSTVRYVCTCQWLSLGCVHCTFAIAGSTRCTLRVLFDADSHIRAGYVSMLTPRGDDIKKPGTELSVHSNMPIFHIKSRGHTFVHMTVSLKPLLCQTGHSAYIPASGIVGEVISFVFEN